MLEIRPNCECCDIDLPVDSALAYICSYECTFCKLCVDKVLSNVCPNCGGGFSKKPIRPAKECRKCGSVFIQKPSAERKHLKYTLDEVKAFGESIKNIEPHNR